MDLNEWKIKWIAEEQAAFQGWDFSYLAGRWESGELTWDYGKIVHEYLKRDNYLLDMGTGGGEFLLTLGHMPHLTCATECYPPNFELCKKRLGAKGIMVKQVFDDCELPFADETFDLIINRQASYDISEVKRILKPGGYFITQQVGSDNHLELRQALFPGVAKPFPNHTLQNNIAEIEAQSFEIVYQEECVSTARYFDVGVIVYLAKVIVWEFPGFSVERCFPELCELHRQMQIKGSFKSREHRFVIIARKK